MKFLIQGCRYRDKIVNRVGSMKVLSSGLGEFFTYTTGKNFRTCPKQGIEIYYSTIKQSVHATIAESIFLHLSEKKNVVASIEPCAHIHFFGGIFTGATVSVSLDISPFFSRCPRCGLTLQEQIQGITIYLSPETLSI